jgi:hypothetical protein
MAVSSFISNQKKNTPDLAGTPFFNTYKDMKDSDSVFQGIGGVAPDQAYSYGMGFSSPMQDYFSTEEFNPDSEIPIAAPDAQNAAQYGKSQSNNLIDAHKSVQDIFQGLEKNYLAGEKFKKAYGAMDVERRQGAYGPYKVIHMLGGKEDFRSPTDVAAEGVDRIEEFRKAQSTPISKLQQRPQITGTLPDLPSGVELQSGMEKNNPFKKAYYSK